MTYTKKLKIGLLITAIITALLISDILPSLLAASIFLLVGISLSYLTAADEVKEEKIKQMSVMIKAIESINLSRDKVEILQLLEMWAKRLVNCEESYLWVRDQGDPTKFTEIIASNRTIKEPQLIDETSSPIGFATILFIPILLEDTLEGVLILADNDIKKLQAFHIKLLEPLVKAAVSNIKNIIEKDREIALIKELLFTTIKAGEGYNPAMVGHALRVAEVALLIGKRLGLNREELRDLEYAAYLHDMGQSAVLYHGLKAEPEGEKIDHTYHPILGAKLIPEGEAFLEIKEAILYHHEHYDGTGYPEGLKYTDIPLIARIIAVADTYDALTSLVNEEERLNHEKSLLSIKRALGSWFDPLVVVAFEEVETEVQALLKEKIKNTDNSVCDK